MTLVTAQSFVVAHLCLANAEIENNLQIYVDMHIVHCNCLFNSMDCKIFKQIKNKKNETEHVFRRQNDQINHLRNFRSTLLHQCSWWNPWNHLACISRCVHLNKYH